MELTSETLRLAVMVLHTERYQEAVDQYRALPPGTDHKPFADSARAALEASRAMAAETAEAGESDFCRTALAKAMGWGLRVRIHDVN